MKRCRVFLPLRSPLSAQFGRRRRVVEMNVCKVHYSCSLRPGTCCDLACKSPDSVVAGVWPSLFCWRCRCHMHSIAAPLFSREKSYCMAKEQLLSSLNGTQCIQDLNFPAVGTVSHLLVSIIPQEHPVMLSTKFKTVSSQLR